MTSIPDSPGKRLREAREALGKTTSELAVKTRIKVQQLEGLEADNYASIPAPMYVRGFLKLYAQELGLDPAPLLDAYKRSTQDPTSADRKPARPSPTPIQEETEPEPRTEKNASSPKRPIFSTRAPLDDPEERRGEGFQFLHDKFNLFITKVLDTDWWTHSWTPRIAGGILAVLLLAVLILNGLSGPDAPTEEAPPAIHHETVSLVLPELENPHVRQPAPLYFELPRTLE